MKKGVKIAIFGGIGVALIVLVIFLVKKFKKTDKTEVPTTEQLEDNPNPNGGGGGDTGTKTSSSVNTNAQRPNTVTKLHNPGKGIDYGTMIPGKGGNEIAS